MQLDRPSGVSRSARTARSTCAWKAQAPAPPISSTTCAASNSTRIIGVLGEERRARSVAKAIARARAEAPILTTSALAEDRRARLSAPARAASQHPSGDHDLPGAAHHGEPRTRRTRRSALRRGSDAQTRRTPRHRRPSIRWRTASPSASSPTRTRTLPNQSRHSLGPRGRAAAELRAASSKAIARRAKPRSRENPRARSAKLRAAERTDAPPLPFDPHIARRSATRRKAPLMFRLFNIAMVLSVLGAAFVLYSLEHREPHGGAPHRHAPNPASPTRREGIKLLNAEWSNLTRPERLQKLANEHLKLQPMKPDQLVSRRRSRHAGARRAAGSARTTASAIRSATS